ncbi:hypothetical protein BpHYR1_037879 [Brachionus plicatilis]|uniref:Uncharacterized protein n=1 Tax=Brachionus plicatilis TaxID=10195 RepID=A0A3M7RHW9_BRAPC|nr:hypothetical protein BpHYR1_037879 [Brachionus plicatilis]
MQLNFIIERLMFDQKFYFAKLEIINKQFFVSLVSHKRNSLFFMINIFYIMLGAGREATWPARKKKWPRPWPAVQVAKKRPVHLTSNDRAWPAKPRPTDGPTVK